MFVSSSKKDRETIFDNFVKLYVSIEQSKFDIECFKTYNLKTPLLIKRLVEKTDITLDKECWDNLSRLIISNYELLEKTEYSAQLSYFKKNTREVKFNDALLIYQNKLLLQIPILIKILYEDISENAKLLNIKKHIIDSFITNKKLLLTDDGIVNKISVYKETEKRTLQTKKIPNRENNKENDKNVDRLGK